MYVIATNSQPHLLLTMYSERNCAMSFGNLAVPWQYKPIYAHIASITELYQQNQKKNLYQFLLSIDLI